MSAVMNVPNKTFPDDVRPILMGILVLIERRIIFMAQMAKATYEGVKKFIYLSVHLSLQDLLDVLVPLAGLE
jgi:hypothetical protein